LFVCEVHSIWFFQYGLIDDFVVYFLLVVYDKLIVLPEIPHLHVVYLIFRKVFSIQFLPLPWKHTENPLNLILYCVR
jgi:hypothetical protein